MQKIISFIFIMSFLISCSPGFRSGETIVSGNTKLDTPPPKSDGDPNDRDDDSDFHPPPESDVSPPVIVTPAPNFCSQLDLVDVTWPAELDMLGRDYLGLALNITGSFEGRNGWANLSNNFDGMGFSIGLLQQNLGMGSLQPMLLEVSNMVRSGQSLQLELTYVQSIQEMLTQWNRDRGAIKKAILTAKSSPDGFFPEDAIISNYDNNFPVSEESLPINSIGPRVEIKSLSSANKNSVNWALKNVYSDGGETFKSQWATNLTNMAQSKPYIGLQLKYAMKLYAQAFQYFKAFQLTDLNHFILMFDFVVQNGGFKSSILTEYNARLRVKPNMTAQEKALLILSLRIKDVLPRWQNDVNARKKTIIFSEGVVHGAKRNLKTEYCYTPDTAVLTKP